jgi:hypothetical protein
MVGCPRLPGDITKRSQTPSRPWWVRMYPLIRLLNNTNCSAHEETISHANPVYPSIMKDQPRIQNEGSMLFVRSLLLGPLGSNHTEQWSWPRTKLINCASLLSLRRGLNLCHHYNSRILQSLPHSDLLPEQIQDALSSKEKLQTPVIMHEASTRGFGCDCEV